MAQSPPNLKIPSSNTIVKVRIIDTTSHIAGIPLALFVQPEIPGFTTLSCPAFSFLIEHPANRKLLFDLGVRKDIENFAPRIRSRIKDEYRGDHLEPLALGPHWRPFNFESSTALIMGPGFKENFTPGYPTNEDCPIRESDYERRELREIAYEQELKIGRFKAFDYFGDGSFYLLDSPGHAIGHMCGLARVTSNSFIFMGGDSCHHGGEFRPSQYLPLPSSISPNPLNLKASNLCPGSMFEDFLPNGDRTKPFYKIARLEDGKGVADDVDEAEVTIEKVIEADAQDEVLVVMAHDGSLLDVVDFFPKYANEFVEKGWVGRGRWLFLKDFAGAVKK